MLRRLVLLAALFLPACLDQEAVDFAFCDDDEACFSEPAGIVCGGVRCDVTNVCYTDWYCGEQGECLAKGYAEDFDDHNLCTIETCDPLKGWEHRTPTAKEIDDHDDCTVDECDPALGIVHNNTCT